MNALPTLQYFDGSGRGESIRMACHLGNLQFNDERLSQEQFGAKKGAGEFPLGSVPVWIEDGQKYCQSNVVLRMVGMRTNQYGTDSNTTWAIDSVMEAVEDNMKHYGPYLMKQVFGGGKAGQEEVDSLCTFLGNLCELVERRLNGHGKKYVAGDKLTVADCKVAAMFFCSVYNENMPMAPEHREAAKATIAKYPKAQQYFEKTLMTRLSGYLAQRPKMAY